VDAEAAAKRWAETWQQSWRTSDADLLAPLYADGARFRTHPFREPQEPLEYARWAYSDEEGVPEVWMGEPFVAGDRAVVEWWANVTEDGEAVSLAGASLLCFDGDGRVVDQRDYWGQAPGHVPPWEGWGR
jgi:hypothetical protein